MSITINRKIGYMGSGTKMKIILNGEEIGTINENQSLKLELLNNDNIVEVTHFGIKSNKIKVSNGDVLEIKRNQWHLMLFPLMLVIVFVIIFIPDVTYTSTIIPINILFLIIIYITKGFSIKKVDINN